LFPLFQAQGRGLNGHGKGGRIQTKGNEVMTGNLKDLGSIVRQTCDLCEQAGYSKMELAEVLHKVAYERTAKFSQGGGSYRYTFDERGHAFPEVVSGNVDTPIGADLKFYGSDQPNFDPNYVPPRMKKAPVERTVWPGSDAARAEFKKACDAVKMHENDRYRLWVDTGPFFVDLTKIDVDSLFEDCARKDMGPLWLGASLFQRQANLEALISRLSDLVLTLVGLGLPTQDQLNIIRSFIVPADSI